MPGVLITRPASSSAPLADRLIQLGYTVFSAPLLEIIPAAATAPDFDQFDGTVLTSANAVTGLQTVTLPPELLAKPCYCVGARTAEAARGFGFTATVLADLPGSGADLARAIIGGTVRPLQLLHITGQDSDTGLASGLRAAGHAVMAWPVYKAQPATVLPDDISAALQRGRIDAVLFFSSRTAATFHAILVARRLKTCCASVTAIGLSQAVSIAASPLPWHIVLTAATPTENAMLDTLHTALPCAAS